MDVGVGFSAEELDPAAIVRGSSRAEEAGFASVWVSDHFHPWIDAQGESPFVWSVLGAIASATERVRIGTGVTCPIMRVHPAVLAQAAATTQLLADGRFRFGVGSGEALNEHIVGRKWPETAIRLQMLEEAVGIIRELWRGDVCSHYGPHFTVENARIYSLPDRAPPVYVSSFGPKSLDVAAAIGDGLITTKPDGEAVRRYGELGGRGPKIAQLKVAWAETRAAAEALVYERWPTSGLSGELSQELPTPAHFAQAVSVLHREDVVGSFPCGPDPQPHLDALRSYADAGFDEVYITQVGTDQERFLRFYAREVLPHLAGAGIAR